MLERVPDLESSLEGKKVGEAVILILRNKLQQT